MEKRRIVIRKYNSSDRSAVEHIQLSTYLLGKPLDVKNKKWIHNSISYYLDKEPQSCYVAQEKGKVVGYLLGCLDDKNNEENIILYLRKIYGKIPLLPFMHKSDSKFWSGQIFGITNAVCGLSEEKKFIHPKNAGHIHINLLPQVRGKGIGSKLLKTFFKYAKSKGVKTIHADSFQTRLNPNKNFWIKNGFKEYSKVKTSFWKNYYPKEEIYLVCYYRKV
ncbi:MAG: GNAT family N-acetyltransferase [Candidatus Woesearchaeota archaeon]